MLKRLLDYLTGRSRRAEEPSEQQEYVAGTREFPPLSEELLKELDRIEPSRDGQVLYRPCRAHLRDGRVLDCVYVVDAQHYISTWGVWPDDDPGKSGVSISEIVRVEESPNRLPAKFANILYFEGESGMGYTLFDLEFKDGSRYHYVSGNAIDFVVYPPGKSAKDVQAVHPHHRGPKPELGSPPYHWCLFGTGDSKKRPPPIPLR